MKLLFLFISIIVTSSFYFGQNSIYIEGTISDFNFVKIPNVEINTSSNPSHKVNTGSNGYYKIKVNVRNGNDTLTFHNMGFTDAQYIVTPKMVKRAKGKSLEHNLILKTLTLVGFTVNSQPVDTVYGSTSHYVEDFIILENKRMLLLVYEKNIRKGSKIILTDNNQKTISQYIVPDEARHFYTDYSGMHYIVCEFKIFSIEVHADEIKLFQVTKEDFYGFYHRVIDTIGDNFYYSDYNEMYPGVKFYYTNRGDSTNTELIEIVDDFTMELYRAQYKYVSGRDKLWAYRKEQATGIDKEIWIGAASFTQDILYQPVYAPLFAIDDSIFVFNQYKSYLYKFDDTNTLVDSVYVNYHIAQRGEKWEKPLIKDKNANQIYGLYNRNGYSYLRPINCDSGSLGIGTKLTNRFVEQIKIYDGYAYYVYRPFESLQKKFLYKEKLKTVSLD